MITLRELLIDDFLINKVKVLTTPMDILHLSPEENSYRILKDREGYLATQFEVKAKCMSFLNDTLELMDIEDIKKDSDSFDLIICSHVMEHIFNDKKAMQELYRVLRPGGTAVYSIPFGIMEEYVQRRPDDHVRMYSKEGFISLLQETGFKVALYSNSNIPNNEILFLAEKL